MHTHTQREKSFHFLSWLFVSVLFILDLMCLLIGTACKKHNSTAREHTHTVRSVLKRLYVVDKSQKHEFLPGLKFVEKKYCVHNNLIGWQLALNQLEYFHVPTTTHTRRFSSRVNFPWKKHFSVLYRSACEYKTSLLQSLFRAYTRLAVHTWGPHVHFAVEMSISVNKRWLQANDGFFSCSFFSGETKWFFIFVSSQPKSIIYLNFFRKQMNKADREQSTSTLIIALTQRKWIFSGVPNSGRKYLRKKKHICLVRVIHQLFPSARCQHSDNR